MSSYSFSIGDLVRFNDDSWWLNRSAGFRKKFDYASLVLVTDDIVKQSTNSFTALSAVVMVKHIYGVMMSLI